MKKSLLIAMGYLFVVISTNTVKAQNISSTDNRLVAFKSSPKFETEKTYSAAAADVNERIVKKFNNNFKTASDASWEKSNTGYSVRFLLNGIQNMVFLDKRGNCESQIRYYTEKQLPADVRHLVRSTYYDYTIKSVTEVSCNNTVAYLVSIEDSTTWKIIRVISGEMDIWKEYTKG